MINRFIDISADSLSILKMKVNLCDTYNSIVERSKVLIEKKLLYCSFKSDSITNDLLLLSFYDGEELSVFHLHLAVKQESEIFFILDGEISPPKELLQLLKSDVIKIVFANPIGKIIVNSVISVITLMKALNYSNLKEVCENLPNINSEKIDWRKKCTTESLLHLINLTETLVEVFESLTKKKTTESTPTDNVIQWLKEYITTHSDPGNRTGYIKLLSNSYGLWSHYSKDERQELAEEFIDSLSVDELNSLSEKQVTKCVTLSNKKRIDATNFLNTIAKKQGVTYMKYDWARNVLSNSYSNWQGHPDKIALIDLYLKK